MVRQGEADSFYDPETKISMNMESQTSRIVCRRDPCYEFFHRLPFWLYSTFTRAKQSMKMIHNILICDLSEIRLFLEYLRHRNPKT